MRRRTMPVHQMKQYSPRRPQKCYYFMKGRHAGVRSCTRTDWQIAKKAGTYRTMRGYIARRRRVATFRILSYNLKPIRWTQLCDVPRWSLRTTRRREQASRTTVYAASVESALTTGR